MTIERSDSGVTFTGAHIERYRLACLLWALKLRVHGVITPGRSPIQVARKDYKLPGHTAAKLIPQVQELIAKWDREHPNSHTEDGK